MVEIESILRFGGYNVQGQFDEETHQQIEAAISGSSCRQCGARELLRSLTQTSGTRAFRRWLRKRSISDQHIPAPVKIRQLPRPCGFSYECCCEHCPCPRGCDLRNVIQFKDPTRGFTFAEPKDNSVCNGMSIPEVIAEEIEVINAIYGSATLQVQEASEEKIKLRFELPLPDDAVFSLIIPADYPQSMPALGQSELGLQQSRDRRLQNIFLIVFNSLHMSFEPGMVCVYDLLEFALPIIACLDGYHLNTAEIRGLVPHIDPDEWKWTSKSFIDMTDVLEQHDCVICCEELFNFETIRAPCGHRFCYNCFQAGWNVAFGAADIYTCCLQRIPLELIRSYTSLTAQDEKKYLKLMKEKDTPNPFFCGSKDCGELIGSISAWDLSRGRVKRKGVKCQTCGCLTCSKCREPFHGVVPCVGDKDLAEYMKNGDVRRCPKCWHGIEKNGGCPHMHCRGCNSHWWWTQEGALIPFRLS